MFEMYTEVMLASDFEPSNEDETYVQDYSCMGRVTDISFDDSQYFVTFEDTAEAFPKDGYEGDIGFWVDVDQVELA